MGCCVMLVEFVVEIGFVEDKLCVVFVLFVELVLFDMLLLDVDIGFVELIED